MTVVAMLSVRRAMQAAFEQYERQAATIMASYGGAIEQTVREHSVESSDVFREVHIVTFPDEQAWMSYRHDPALQLLATLRAQAIVQTELLIGDAGPRYAD